MQDRLYSVSISRNLHSFDPRHHTHFDTVQTPFDKLCDIILSGVWSPLVWSGGVRRNDSYLSTSLIALDFDSGDTIEDVKETVEALGLACIIGTTKSHRQEKIKAKTGEVLPACDRFRLVVPATDCPSAGDYRYTMKSLMDSLFTSADVACKDTARFFYPCTAVVHTSAGKSLGFMTRPPDIAEDDARRDSYHARRLKAVGKVYHRLPQWTKVLITDEQENRSGSIVQVASALYRAGWSQAEIVSELHARKSPLISLIADRGLAEFNRCIQSGINRVREG